MFTPPAHHVGLHPSVVLAHAGLRKETVVTQNYRNYRVP